MAFVRIDYAHGTVTVRISRATLDLPTDGDLTIGISVGDSSASFSLTPSRRGSALIY